MSKKKILCYVLLTAMLVSMFAAGEVSVAAEQQKPAYSNLADAKSRKEVRSALLSAGISAKTADAWLKDVVSYNKTIKNTSLVKKGFKKMGKKPPVYNENRISKLWLKKNKLIIGYNCRITAYDLMKDYIKVGNTGKANPSQLFMDQDALKNAPTKKIPYFNFEVPTELSGVDPAILDPRDTYADASEWEAKAKDLASRFVKNFAKYEGNEAGKALVSAGPEA